MSYLKKMSDLKRKLTLIFYSSFESTKDKDFASEEINIKDGKFKLFLLVLANILLSALLAILSLIFLLIKIILMIYHSIKSFFYLLCCAILQIFKIKRKKLKRCSSGFISRDTYPSNSTKKITLVVDLDNTLIFSTVNKLEKVKNYVIMDNKFFVYKRPHLEIFLNSMSQFCDICIYTAATKEYADKIIDHIDKNKLISARYYRQDCLNIGNVYYKDLSQYSFEEKNLIIIDDSPHCHLSYAGILYF